MRSIIFDLEALRSTASLQFPNQHFRIQEKTHINIEDFWFEVVQMEHDMAASAFTLLNTYGSTFLFEKVFDEMGTE